MMKKITGTYSCGLLILLQSVLYGVGDPLSKSACGVLSVYSLLSVRYLIALAVLILMGRRRILDGLKCCPVRVWLVPSLCIALCYVLDNVALWAVYDFTICSYPMFATDVIVAGTCVINVFRYRHNKGQA